MCKVKCLNPISKVGTDSLLGHYELTDDINQAEAILVRSADMKAMEIPEKVIAVAYSKTKKKYYYTVDRLFRDYDSLASCLADHTRILQKPGYADAWPYRHDAEEFARRIADNVGCKYATDPFYINSITKLIRQVRGIVGKEG